MSARDFLPWMSDATSSPSDDGPADTGRRAFIKRLGMGGLVVVAGPMGIRRFTGAEKLLAALAEPWSPAVYVSIADDGIVTLICHRSEMGQGIRTTMPMIIADEMEADWAHCRVVQADGDEAK
jgi:isoquinoline 1-oxidoreductase subunit beta